MWKESLQTWQPRSPLQLHANKLDAKAKKRWKLKIESIRQIQEHTPKPGGVRPSENTRSWIPTTRSLSGNVSVPGRGTVSGRKGAWIDRDCLEMYAQVNPEPGNEKHKGFQVEDSSVSGKRINVRPEENSWAGALRSENKNLNSTKSVCLYQTPSLSHNWVSFMTSPNMRIKIFPHDINLDSTKISNSSRIKPLLLLSCAETNQNRQPEKWRPLILGVFPCPDALSSSSRRSLCVRECVMEIQSGLSGMCSPGKEEVRGVGEGTANTSVCVLCAGKRQSVNWI